MMPALEPQIYAVFTEYSRLYQVRNNRDGDLSPELQKEWIEVNFTLDSIFSGFYRPDANTDDSTGSAKNLKNKMPVEFLRVPTNADVLCETKDNFFSGTLHDISVGGAYIHTPVPIQVDSPVRLTFCTFRDRQALELEGRIAWSNPGGIRKNNFREGAGVQFTNCDEARRGKLQDYVYELVEDTLSRAHLI